MGLPASGREAIYRNPIETVSRFLHTHHDGHYKVFNLCNERAYDISCFGDACATFPFEDHGAPPLVLVDAFCASAGAWLARSASNVVVVHCKAGKGRTGLMACCLLLHLGIKLSAEDAIMYYNAKRTRDGRGLTVPSQRRYVRYYERVLGGVTHEGVVRTLEAIRLHGATARHPRLVATINCHGASRPEAPHVLVLDVRPGAPNGAMREQRCGSVVLSGDVRLDLADERGTLLCRLYLHPALEEGEASFVLQRDKQTSEVDVQEKGVLSDGFTIVLCFGQVSDDADGAAAAKSSALAGAAATAAADGNASTDASMHTTQAGAVAACADASAPHTTAPTAAAPSAAPERLRSSSPIEPLAGLGIS